MTTVLLSPLAGWVSGLNEVPDEAFAGGVLGDGMAIDPIEGRLLAPCDGVIVTVASTGHAVAIRSDEGAEMLIHVGIDSVALKGEGFQTHVTVGQGVAAGEILLSFDLDIVARRARSLITPVLITNSERLEIVSRAEGAVRAGDALMTLQERAPLSKIKRESGLLDAVAIRFRCGLPEGVHARPAARIAAAARGAGAEVTVGAHGRTTSALSVLGLMGLGVRSGDAVTLSAEGSRAEEAFTLLREAFAATPVSERFADNADLPVDGGVLLGTKGSPGIASGAAFRHVVAAFEPAASATGVLSETRDLEAALSMVRGHLKRSASGDAGPGGEILRAHLVLLDDPALRDAASEAIDQGASAGAAWRRAIHAQTALLSASEDARVRERQADLLDLERQVLAALHGPAAAPPPPPPGAIVLAEELLPSEFAALADLGVGGVAMAGGGATSHVAIMAAAMGLPLLTAVSGLKRIQNGTPVILDADRGRLLIAPDAATVADIQDRRDRRLRRRAAASNSAMEPCLTTDGLRIAVHANLGGVEEAEHAVGLGAEGCGLLRSEFLFQHRSSPPDEDEQVAAYQAVADRLQGRPLTIRTLDVGSDKPASYLPLPHEANPALGLRGVRVSLWKPELLHVQLRAILRVRGDVSILVPMVTSVQEIAAVRVMLNEEAASVGVQAQPLGVMIETPAAALTVRDLCGTADFFSIGANDLAQYALAMDRTAPMLAAKLDGLHPGVLILMQTATHAALGRGRKVSVCGGLAADHAAIPLLIGLGVSALSLPSAEIAEAKALIRTLSADDCRAFADGAETYDSAAALRRAVAERWPQVGDAS